MFKFSIFLLFFTLINLTEGQNSYPKREVRGAWVATVKNIDWPSTNLLSSGDQVEEIVELFDQLQKAGINTVLFQVRTECDALYNSDYEPWSYWLTGEQGRAPDPFYDPLEFAITEAHARGMELHAWLNPYRAVRNTREYKAARTHVSETNPEWLLEFDDYKMLNPGMPQVRKHITNVVTDIIVKYKVDGIHFDDYFYPYSPKVSTEDAHTFKLYNRGIADIDDWRRDNINLLMAEIYEIIKAVRPEIKFGISPFGIVQNHYAGTNGFSSYDILYCDPLTWIESETVDYINPQLYWEIGHDKADFAKLLPWWASVKGNRHLYVGHYSSKFSAQGYEGDKAMIGNQIRMNRSLGDVDGSVFFSAKSISLNFSGLLDSMQTDWYRYPAFPPTMIWKDAVPPNQVTDFQAVIVEGHLELTWNLPPNAADGETAEYFVLYRYDPEETIDLENPAKIHFITNGIETIFIDYFSEDDDNNYKYVITAMDKLHNESFPTNTLRRFSE